MKIEIEEIRAAVANYISSEGCDCCQGDRHLIHKKKLAELLKVPAYDDNSGFKFYFFENKDK